MTPEQWTLAESLYLEATAVAADERHAWLERGGAGLQTRPIQIT